MSTLKELIDKHGLPLKVQPEAWVASKGFFEVLHVRGDWCVGFIENGHPGMYRLSTEGWSLYQEPRPKLRAWLDPTGTLRLQSETLHALAGWKHVKFNAADNTWEVCDE